MKKLLWLAAAMSLPALSWAAATSVTVSKSGAADFNSIQAALDSGATTITITDSGHYNENVEIGQQDAGGAAVTITSTKSGANRPIVTPAEFRNYRNSTRSSQAAGFCIFASGSKVSNLIIEANPDLATGPMGAMFIMADNVLVENCMLRVPAGATVVLNGSSSPLLFLGQEGDGSGVLTPGTNPLPGGRDSDGTIIRNTEFVAVPADLTPLNPQDFENFGYLGQAGVGGASGFARMDHQTDGSDVTVTFDGCYFHHCRDYGIFPTNRKTGGGNVNVFVKNCRFDAQAKFQVRGRGANIFVENSIFSRSNQIRNGDGENSAVALQTNDGHVPHGSVKNSLFVNCGSANAQQGYYGGINNNNAGLVEVENCTFVNCLNGVDTGSGGNANMIVKNSVFHNIGLNTPPAIDANYTTLTPEHPDLVDGAYKAWSFGLANFGANKWSGVFNRFKANDSIMTIDHCLVGTVDSEDTRSWDDALASGEVTGSRLTCGTEASFVGLDTITRGVPVFLNTDVNAPNAYKLAASSPGQGLGADVSTGLGMKLAMAPSGNSAATISWTAPIWVTGYVLKGTASLTSPNWIPVAGVANNSVSVPVGTGAQYYALVKE